MKLTPFALVLALSLAIAPVANAKDTNPDVKKLSSSSSSSSSGTPVSLAAQTKLSLKEAEDIALKQVPGKVKRVELEWDDNVLQYDFEICQGKVRKNVRIDAKSGQVIEVDKSMIKCDEKDDDKD